MMPGCYSQFKQQQTGATTTCEYLLPSGMVGSKYSCVVTVSLSDFECISVVDWKSDIFFFWNLLGWLLYRAEVTLCCSIKWHFLEGLAMKQLITPTHTSRLDFSLMVLAGPPVYLHDLCCTTLSVPGYCSLCSTEQGVLIVPFACTKTKHCRAFSVAGHLLWNGLSLTDLSHEDSLSMFPLSCAHVRAHTGRETSAHKKTWSAHRISFQKWFFTYFMHIVAYADESW